MFQHNHKRFNSTLALPIWPFGIHRFENSQTQRDGTQFAKLKNSYKAVQRLFGGQTTYRFFSTKEYIESLAYSLIGAC